MPSIYQRNGRWYLSYFVKGRQVRVSLRTKDERIAQDALDKIDAQKRLGILGLPNRYSPAVAELFTDYAEWEKEHRAPRTATDTKYHYDRDIGPMLGDRSAASLGQRDVDELVAAMRKRGYGTRTINLRLETLRKVLRRAKRVGEIGEIPVDVQLLPQPRALPRYLTPQQFGALRGVLGPVHMARAEFAALTGIPDSELGRLAWANVDLEGRVVRYCRGKTSREIVVPLNARAVEIAEERQKKFGRGAYVFGGIKTLRDVLRRAGKALGFRVTPHMLRHTFATSLLSRGVPIEHVSDLLGHTSLGVTRIYARVLPDYLRAAVNRLDEQHKPGT